MKSMENRKRGVHMWILKYEEKLYDQTSKLFLAAVKGLINVKNKREIKDDKNSNQIKIFDFHVYEVKRFRSGSHTIINHNKLIITAETHNDKRKMKRLRKKNIPNGRTN